MREQRERYIFFGERDKLHCGHNVYDNVSDVVFLKFCLMSKLEFHCGFTLFEEDNPVELDRKRKVWYLFLRVS